MRVRLIAGWGKVVGARLALATVVALLLAACTVPGLAPTPTISSAAKTAVAYAPPPSPTVARTPATRTAPAAPSRTAGRPTPTPGKNAFTPTKEEPCRPVRFAGLIPEKKSSVETVGQVYRCFLLHYVDHLTLDNTTLLHGAWDGIGAATGGKIAAEDLAPLALTGDRDGDWAIFAARFTALTEKYRGAVDASALARAAVSGMADSLQDNHVAYLEPKRWRSIYISELGLSFYPSAGFELALDDVTGKYFLYDVHPNTPAARAGLKRGDFIEKVGGRPAGRGLRNQALYDLQVGLPGTGDLVEVRRPASGQSLTVLIQVSDVEIPLIETRVFPGGVGYLKLGYFSMFADEEFDKALAGLQRQGIRSLIFDVRQNPGGSVAALTHILSHFTHQGPLGITIDEHGTREAVNPDPSVPLLGLPWLVLCDGDSASSADVTAAVAKDRGGHLVGTRSAGALGGALFFEFEDGSAMEITVVRVLGPNGEEINNIGVMPDHEIPLTPADLSAGNDPPLQHAVAELARR